MTNSFLTCFLLHISTLFKRLLSSSFYPMMTLVAVALGCSEHAISPIAEHNSCVTHNESLLNSNAASAEYESLNAWILASQAALDISKTHNFMSRVQAAMRHQVSSFDFKPIALADIAPELDRVFAKAQREYRLQIRCLNPERLNDATAPFGVMLDQKEFSVKTRSEKNSVPQTFVVYMSDGGQKRFQNPTDAKGAERLRQSFAFPLFVLSYDYTKAERQKINQEYVEEMSRYLDGRPFRDLEGRLYARVPQDESRAGAAGSGVHRSGSLMYQLIDEEAGDGSGAPPGAQPPPGVTPQQFRSLLLTRLHLKHHHDWNFLDGQEEVEIYVGEHGLPLPLHSAVRLFVSHNRSHDWSPPMGWTVIGYVWRQSANPSAAPLKVYALEDDEEPYVTRIGTPTVWGAIGGLTANFAVLFGLPFPLIFTGVTVSSAAVAQSVLDAARNRLGSSVTVGYWEFARHYDFRVMTRGQSVEAITLRGPGFFASDEFYADGAIGITEETMINAQSLGNGEAITTGGVHIDYRFRLGW